MSEKFILERKLENKKDGKNRKCFSDFLDILLQAKVQNFVKFFIKEIIFVKILG